MRLSPLTVALCWVCLGGCASLDLRPSRTSAPVDPAPLVASLEAYNAGPSALRLTGSLKSDDRGAGTFGATVVEGMGLRFDVVTGPFSVPVVALACRSGSTCTAYLPGRRKAYVDESGRWEWLFGPILRGRLPRLAGAAVAGAWSTVSGRPLLVLEGEGGWREHVEFSPDARLPRVVFLGRADSEPDLRIEYGEFLALGDGQPFPGRVVVRLLELRREYEISFDRAEPVPQGTEPERFVLSLPPGTAEESLRGMATWEETGLPVWPPEGKE